MVAGSVLGASGVQILEVKSVGGFKYEVRRPGRDPRDAAIIAG